MKTNIINYAIFTYPSMVGFEEEIVKVKKRDLKTLDIPEGVVAVQFMKRIESFIKKLKNKKPIKIKSAPTGFSPMYYVGTKLYSIREVERETQKEKNKLTKEIVTNRKKMISEMKKKKQKISLKCLGEYGFVPMQKNDRYLLINSDKRTRGVIK